MSPRDIIDLIDLYSSPISGKGILFKANSQLIYWMTNLESPCTRSLEFPLQGRDDPHDQSLILKNIIITGELELER